MPKKTIWTITICLFCLAIIGYLLQDNRGDKVSDAPQRVLLVNSGGPVVFEHEMHSQRQKIPCSKCHHESTNIIDSANKQVLPCQSCHGQKYDQQFKENHKTQFANSPQACITCHHFAIQAEDWQHNAHYEENSLECAECHHKGREKDGKPQNCATCHTSAKPNWQKIFTLPNSNKDKQNNADNAASANKDTELEKPNLVDAVHSRCINCHEIADSAQNCSTCHKVQKTLDLAKMMQTKQGVTATASNASSGQDSINSATANTDAINDANNKDTKATKAVNMTESCNVCHSKTSVEKLIPSRMDASHKQCMTCHETSKKGPFGAESCNKCHLK